MLLEVAGVASWDFASQFGGWTERSTDRQAWVGLVCGLFVVLGGEGGGAPQLRQGTEVLSGGLWVGWRAVVGWMWLPAVGHRTRRGGAVPNAGPGADWQVARSTPCRLDLAAASAGVQVSLAVNVAKANHLRALYNMALACMVIVLLLTFVVLFKYSIWKVGGRTSLLYCQLQLAYFPQLLHLSRFASGTQEFCVALARSCRASRPAPACALSFTCTHR